MPRDFLKNHRPGDGDLFWSKVDKSGDCWVWRGRPNTHGYGRIGSTYAHRYSWVLSNGEIPDGLNVLHRCDNPPCVRPDHLFLGTQTENVQDMWGKGRRDVKPLPALVQPRGEAHGQAVLTESQVIEARALFASGATHRLLALRYGVSRATIGNAVNRKTWRHVA